MKENNKGAKKRKSVVARILKKVKTRNKEVLIVTKKRNRRQETVAQSSDASLDASADSKLSC